MDCLALSITTGTTIKQASLKNFMLIAFFWALFHFISPIVGWQIGYAINRYVDNFAYWLAFALLLFVGIKMIVEGLKKEEQNKKNILNIWTLILMSIALSIDAFAIGISFAFLKYSIIFPATIFFIITFAISFTGLLLGKKIKKYLKLNFDMIGGIILILLAIKIIIFK